jgi:hypothetical protein
MLIQYKNSLAYFTNLCILEIQSFQTEKKKKEKNRKKGGKGPRHRFSPGQKAGLAQQLSTLKRYATDAARG